MTDDLAELARRAADVREGFAEFERSTYGSEWSIQELLLGLVVDVGDLIGAVQRVEGRRPSSDGSADRSALEHELADCLWVLLVVAQRYDVDLGAVFGRTMDQLEDWLARAD
ncbi:MAG: MazG nucleotide pyrophosphohydrolase domain-containing protein [Actinomycetota bacterium]